MNKHDIVTTVNRVYINHYILHSKYTNIWIINIINKVYSMGSMLVSTKTTLTRLTYLKALLMYLVIVGKPTPLQKVLNITYVYHVTI